MGTVYAFAGKRDSALIMYRKALELDRDQSTALFNRNIVDNATSSVLRDLLWTTRIEVHKSIIILHETSFILTASLPLFAERSTRFI